MSDANRNNSGSSDDELRSEFNLLKTNKFKTLCEVMDEMLNHEGGDPITEAFWLLENKSRINTSGLVDYDEDDYATEYDSNQYEIEKNNLLKKTGIDCDKLVFDSEKWLLDRETSMMRNFINDNMIKNTDLFREGYVRSINRILDETLHRGLVDTNYAEDDPVHQKLDLAGAKLTKVPAFIRKYSGLDSVVLSSNNFETISKFDFPEKITKLDLSYCQNLTVLGPDSLPATANLILLTCKNLKSIHLGAIPRKEMVIDLDIRGTAINSADQIILPKGDYSDKILSITIPTTFSSLKLNNKTFIIRYKTEGALPNIKTFFGMSYDTYFYLSGNIDMYDLDLDRYIPNIPNAKMTYDAYKTIFLKYPDLLINKTLSYIYKAIQPTSLFLFELVLNRIKGSGLNVEQVENVALLISLLYK
jgi:hypothetical protein